MNSVKNSLVDIITFYVLISSCINISILLFIKDDITVFIGHETIDFIMSIFLVNICVVIVLNYVKNSKILWRRNRKCAGSKNNSENNYKNASINLKIQ